MLIEQAMTTAPLCCNLDDTLESIAYQMWNGDFGAMPVLNEQGMPVGIVTDRDIAMALALRHARAAQLRARDLVGERSLVSCSPTWELKQALKLMTKEKIRRLPVVDDEHRVVGLLSLCDIVEVAGSGRKKSDVSITELVDSLRRIAQSHKASADTSA